jgi:hypothetical protein
LNKAKDIDIIGAIRDRAPPAIDQSDHRVPPDIEVLFTARLRKRAERRRDAEAAAAKRAAADAELLAKLKDATGGNYTLGPGIEDLGSIKMALEIVGLDDVLSAIRHRTDLKCCPKNEPATSWGDERLLKAIAEYYCRYSIVPSLVSAWGAAKVPGKRAAAPAAEDVSTMDTPETSLGKPADASEASPASATPRFGKRTSGALRAAYRQSSQRFWDRSGGGGSVDPTCRHARRADAGEYPRSVHSEPPTAPASIAPAGAAASTTGAPSGAPGRVRTDLR